MLSLKLSRPLAIFDIEATGVNPRTDRVVELAIIKLLPSGDRETHVMRVNPTIPIPAEATAIHGISDADVAGEPTFADLAPPIRALFEGCDLAGYNLIRYDIPMLIEEFARCKQTIDLEKRRIVDVQRIFHMRERRDLSAALAFYCGQTHDDAHGAEADTEATLSVLEGQLARYDDLPRTVEELDKLCNPKNPQWVDRAGKLKWLKGEVVINFGRKQDKPLRVVADQEPSFLNWMLKADFPLDVREIIQEALQGRFPEPPAADDD